MTTLLVSTVGGHLTQLHGLVPRFDGLDTCDRLWVTHRTEQSESLLAHENVIWVPYIEERDVTGVLRAIGPALRLIEERNVDSVVSTGSAIAVAYLAAGRLRGRRAVFIESTAFVRSRSRTGQIVRRIPGVETFTQSRAMSNGHWQYRGSVLDNYESERAQTRDPKRLVVTVGTSRSFGYRRLLERLVSIVPHDVDVLWQTGSTDTDGLDIDSTPWMPHAQLAAAAEGADVVIAHAGGGSALTSLDAGRRPLLVPRKAASGDFNDDHQLEIAELLAERRLALVRDVEDLSWSDVVEAARWRVHRAGAAGPFDLHPGRR
ncbi:MAG: glycosyltransferase [Acidimicrobiales bacterium]